jgi:hypothetical protein
MAKKWIGTSGAPVVGLIVLLALTWTPFAAAANPVVKTVPWVAANPLIPHDTWSGKSVTLKGTSDVQGANIQWTWDFGDGSPVASGTVANRYVIEALHTYAGAVGTVFTARLTVQNTTTGETGSKAYYVAMRALALPVEVNVAIDEGLWAIHKAQARSTSGGVDLGNWGSWSSWYGLQGANINAFEVNGHLESGNPDNPYTETVARGMRRLFQMIVATGIGAQALGNPDFNGNGLAVYVNQSYYLYQGGMVMDAIVASGTPDAIAPTGPANVIGRKYKDILQDMVDWYSYCQYDDGNNGGWRYSCNEFPDNSACQWAAIGLIPAERVWGLGIPAWVKTANHNWLSNTHHAGGSFAYQAWWWPWGSFATTPSGMVQMVMDGMGRGSPGPPYWDKAETYMRDNWGSSILDYYYGLFSFTKSMLLHNPPIVMLQSTTAGVAPLDWYNAEISKGAPANGVARHLVSQQRSDGLWWYHDPDGNLYAFETAWAIIMLNQTLFEAGTPVAVAKATPNPATAGATITLDGSDSYHQDASKIIDSWQWDLNNDGTFDVTGVVVTTSFPAIGDYLVRLRVSDNGSPEKTADTIITVRINTPPLAPTANAGGPYNFCPGPAWFLNGTGSSNPDEGQHDPGAYPGDTIVGSFTWDLNGDSVFGDATGPVPNVSGAWGPGSYLVQLKVCDTTAASYPSSGMPNLCNTDSAQVTVTATCPGCCIISARPKDAKVQLTWRDTGAHHYNVYRGTVSGGPYLKIASTTSRYSTYLDNGPLTNGVTYYYVVRQAQVNETETCQSNQASATPRAY